jgi:single-strand DNA-binding protein
MLNRVTIIGNVGSEPEMRFTPTGKAVTSFRVAVNNKFGESETTEWFAIVTWDKLAEQCNQYLNKGKQVYVEGRLQTRTWEGDDGVKHYKTEVIANRVLFLGKKEAGEAESEEIF